MKTGIIAKFRASSIKRKKGVIYYQVTHKRVIRQIKSKYRIHSHEWCTQGNFVAVDDSEDERAKELRLIAEKVKFEVRQLQKLAGELMRRGAMNHCDDLVVAYREMAEVQTFFEYIREKIAQRKESSRFGIASNYVSTFSSFYKFRKGEDMLIEGLTKEVVSDYEAYLTEENVTKNSLSFYMRNLRAIYNKAVSEGITEQHYPFEHVYTGIDKTEKSTLTLEEVKRIKEYDQEMSPAAEYARDMFLFSFYTQGMSFIDMANLRKENIEQGVLSYRRRKRGAMIYIKWEQCMQDIVDRYYVAESVYLLPIIANIANKPNEHNRYKNELYKVNSWLTKLSKEMGLTIALTMNVARHSWALAAAKKNIPLAVLTENLGYSNTTATQIYLESLDVSAVHEANRVIISEFEE